MKKRLTPFVGDTASFYNDLVERGVFSREEIQRGIRNSTSDYESKERHLLEVFTQPSEEVQKTLRLWTPQDDIRLLTVLYGGHSIIYIASIFKCAKIVIECRLHCLFGTKNCESILQMEERLKEEVYKKAMANYDQWVENIEFDEIVGEFARI